MSIQKSIINHLSQPPNLQYAEQVLSSHFGKEKAQAILALGRETCGISDHNESIGRLEPLYKHLSAQEGKLGVYGLSLWIKLKSYSNLITFSKTALL